MVEEVPEESLKAGHHFDTGAFLLDLYRLLCMFVGDRRLAEMEAESIVIETLRYRYVDSECIRILTSTSAALRIVFDQNEKEFAEISQRSCGELYSNWPKNPNAEVLMLREACNKIIHATKVHRDVMDPDPGYNPNQKGVYLLPYLFLHGTRDGQNWKAKLSIIDFARHAAATLIRY
jgi:hypothetical protein